MELRNFNQVPAEPNTTAAVVGGGITTQRFTPDSKDYRLSMTHYEPGVRLKYHSHDVDQLLIYWAGKPLVAVEDEEAVLGPGDFVLVRAGESTFMGQLQIRPDQYCR